MEKNCPWQSLLIVTRQPTTNLPNGCGCRVCADTNMKVTLLDERQGTVTSPHNVAQWECFYFCVANSRQQVADRSTGLPSILFQHQPPVLSCFSRHPASLALLPSRLVLHTGRCQCLFLVSEMNMSVESRRYTGSETKPGPKQMARETDQPPEASGEGAQCSGLSHGGSERKEKAGSGDFGKTALGMGEFP